MGLTDMTPDWARTADIKEVKHGLPIPWVLGPAATRKGDRYVYHSPFREDNNPSLDVWYDPEKGWRWGDFAEGTGGDVFDLCVRQGKDFQDVRELYALYIKAGSPSYDQAVEKVRFDPIAYFYGGEYASPDEYWSEWSHLTADRPVMRTCSPPSAGWHLTAEDGWEIQIKDRDGELVGVRWRRLDGSKRAQKGYDSMDLYYPFKPSDDSYIVLCEGETDTLTASVLFDGRAAGIFGGAGTYPQSVRGVDRLPELVYIAFDNDDAGNDKANKWIQFLSERGHDVRRVVLPEGSDLSEMTEMQITLAVSFAEMILSDPQLIDTDSQGMKVGNRLICNWSCVVTHRIEPAQSDTDFLGGYRIEVNNKVLDLPVSSLATQNAMVRWANKYGLSWFGNSQDAQKLKAQLDYWATGKPVLTGVTRIGYHQGAYILPDETIGQGEYVYIPPPTGVDVAFNLSGITYEPYEKPEIIEALNLMRGWYGTEVMDPIIAWVLASIVRPMFPQFPILSVQGSSGSGKTTLINAVLEQMVGPPVHVNLTGTTPYGLESYFDSMNAYPLWVDEYRPGGRDETMQVLNQLARDSYNGAPSVKGGRSEDKTKVTAVHTVVPLIVSGEQSFAEVSTKDRSVMLRLSKSNQGEIRPQGCMGKYLRDYMINRLPNHPAFDGYDITPEGPQFLKDRLRYNIGVLSWGWNVFDLMTMDMTPWSELTAPDWSGILEASEEATYDNPLYDLLDVALVAEGRDVPYHETDEYKCLNVTKLVAWAERNGYRNYLGSLNARDIGRQLTEMGYERSRPRHGGQRVNVYLIPKNEGWGE